MRVIAAVLVAILLLLQYRLWLGDGSMREVVRLRAEIALQQGENETLRERNRMLAAEVQDLKQGTIAIEERARTDLGMIGRGETFYQVVAPKEPVMNETTEREARPGEWRTVTGAPGTKAAPGRSGQSLPGAARAATEE